jgi:hypothetical protein
MLERPEKKRNTGDNSTIRTIRSVFLGHLNKKG